MARQADRFGQAGLARAAEIVSTGLDQMRGATSPRLLLELTCAQVLLPAAATDEKSLLARLERLEKGNAVPRRCRSHPRARRSPLRTMRPNGSGCRAFRARGGPPPRPPQPAPPARRPPPPDQPRPASPAVPARAGAARTRPPGPAPPRLSAAPRPAPAASAADSLRQSWDAILEAVKQERKVAWMLLSNASVLSLEDGILTLRFPRDGDMKGFSVSGHDAILKRVLSADFGLNVTIKGVAGGDVGRSPGRAAWNRSAGRAARPPAVRRDPAPAPSEAPPPEFAGPEFAGPSTSRTTSRTTCRPARAMRTSRHRTTGRSGTPS